MTRLHVPPGAAVLEVDRFTRPYFEAARERRLVVCACAVCGTLRMPPGPFCPRCQSQDVAWPEMRGTGTIYTFTIVHRAPGPVHSVAVPYAPAVVAIDGAPGVRLVSAIVESEAEAVRVGASVRPVWHTLDDGHVVPFFTLI